MIVLRFALFGFCLTALLLGLFYHPSNGQITAECRNSHQIQARSPVKPILSYGGTNTSSNEIKNTEHQKKITTDISCSDLRAQWDMTDAATRTYWLTVLGLMLLAITLYETLVAGTALTKQNRIALKATKAEFQPYLSFSNLYLAVDNGADDWEEPVCTQAPFDDRDGFVSFLLTVHYSNWGKTPAENIRFEGVVLIQNLINDEVILDGNVLEPLIDLKDYLISSDGDVEYIFTIKAPSKKTLPYEPTHMDLLMKRIKVTLNVFFTDQFSAKERHYLCVWDGLCHDNEILRTSVKEIKQT